MHDLFFADDNLALIALFPPSGQGDLQILFSFFLGIAK